MSNISIITCFEEGTQDILRTWLSAVSRHTHMPVNVFVVKASAFHANTERNLKPLCGGNITLNIINVPSSMIKTEREHGSMLDVAVSRIVSSDYIVTMDSDCFPVQDGWLDKMLNDLESDNSVATSGILYPWQPPSQDMNRKKIEYRARSQYCWNMTHVACEAVRFDEMMKAVNSGYGYASGDDTGLAVKNFILKDGRYCTGYMPTRCPIPLVDFDAEYNRYSCVVYGDTIIHIGGATRQTVQGHENEFERAFGWAEEKILEEKGAEFLLDDELSYRFQFDREENVAAEKMQRLFGLKSQRMTA